MKEQEGKYKILYQLYNFIFGEEFEGGSRSRRGRQPYLTFEQREFLLIGGDAPGLEEDGKVLIIGLCQLCEINLNFFDTRKSKRSCELALIIIHKMLTDQNYSYLKEAQEDFMGFEANIYRGMDLDKHFINFQKKGNVIKQNDVSCNYALDILWFIKSHQVNRPLD